MSSVVMFCYYDQYCRTGRASARSAASALLTLMWSARLGVFLYLRYKETKHDFRFEGARQKNRLGYLFFLGRCKGLGLYQLPCLA